MIFKFLLIFSFNFFYLHKPSYFLVMICIFFQGRFSLLLVYHDQMLLLIIWEPGGYLWFIYSIKRQRLLMMKVSFEEQLRKIHANCHPHARLITQVFTACLYCYWLWNQMIGFVFILKTICHVCAYRCYNLRLIFHCLYYWFCRFSAFTCK